MPGDGYVTWGEMVAYVRDQLAPGDREILDLAATIDRHEAWHRRRLEEQVVAASARGPALWAMVLSTLTALAAVAAVIISVVALR